MRTEIMLSGSRDNEAAASSISAAASATTTTSREALKGKVIVMVGDLKHGRTIHSLAKLLAANYGDLVTIRLVSPPELELPSELCDYLRSCDTGFTCHTGLTTEVLADADVLYVTRVQKERFADQSQYEELKLRYIVTPQLLVDTGAKASLVIMHPLPRVGEIDPAVDSDPRAAYFRQMENGMYVRMALVALVLGADVGAL